MTKRILTIILAAIICLGGMSVAVSGENSVGAEAAAYEGNVKYGAEYSDYIKKYANYKKAETVIEIGTEKVDSLHTTAKSGEENGRTAVSFENKGDTAVYEFTVDDEGLYNVQFEFLTLDNKVADVSVSIAIDGTALFNGMNEIALFRHWKDSSEQWKTDKHGNQYSSEQIEIKDYFSQLAFDDTGVVLHPYEFALSKGTHTVTVTSIQQSFALSKVSFVPPENTPNYAEVAETYQANNYADYSGNDIVIQGEDADIKTAFSLTAKSDNLSAAVTPISYDKTVINYIGSSNWSSAGQSLIWKFNAPSDGLYEMRFHYKQSTVVNGSVFRWLKIDGKTPFKEAESIRFNYNSGWTEAGLSTDNGENAKIYLSEGEHTLELAVTMSEMSDYYNSLKDILDSISAQYLKITMITGETPDTNRDYELFKQIPDLESEFNSDIDKIEKLAEEMKKMSEKSSTQYVSTLYSMQRVLKQMVETKYLAHTHKTELYNQYCSLSSMLNEMLSMPLSLDEIRIIAPGKKTDYSVSFFKQVSFSAKKFISSFAKEYGKEESGKSLKLWVNWGRDQTQVLNTLIQETFTPKTGISVNVEITGATIIQGMLTHNAPDIAIGVARSNPVNYAMRDAVYNLKNFDDFNEVKSSFASTATDPYVYNDGCYALPDTQNFFIMFYRTDILKQLNLEVPETWDEFMEVSSVIQRNNMSVYLPYTKLSDATIVNAGIGNLNLFATMMVQNRTDFYDKITMASILDSTSAIDIFDSWTKLYTKYKIPVESNFYNRFRIGVSPLGIAPYTLYTTLEVAAPEIKDSWCIALIPGTTDESGNVNHGCAGSGTGCFILNTSSKKDESWEFLKWWTSSSTQLSYSRNVESIIGPTGRIATSNIEAFSNYSWNYGDLEILLEQWSNVKEIPEVPGSYYMVRSVDQAFWSVINGNSTACDALLRWNAVANDEIKRKIDEYKD